MNYKKNLHFNSSILFFVILSLQFLCIPVYAGLVGYWDFNEGSGQPAADKTGNGNNGILSSGVQWTSGKFGSGVKFDSINDYVKVTNRTGFNFSADFTVAMWINPSDWKSNEPLFSNGLVRIYHRGDWAGDVVYFLIKINSTESPGDSAWDGWAGVKTSQPLSENKWYSIIGVKSGNIMTIYLNGIKSGEGNILAGYSTDNSSQGDLFIGGDGGTNFNSVIDEVKIWNSALNVNEVQNLYQYPPMLLPIGNMTATEGTSLRFTVEATDPYNSRFSYSASNIPVGASFSPLPTQEIFAPYSSGRKFFWTPSSEQVGTHTMCFSVSNGTKSDSECITITVNKNYLLHPSECPSGFSCRGDGVCTENVKSLYGADAKPTTDPLGGGVGYRNIIDPKSVNFTVRTRSELITALKNAVSGQIIYVNDSATINMTGDQNIVIPAGVTLASGRGANNALGALIYTNAIETFPLFITAGEGVRVTGIRLQGPDPERRTEQMAWLETRGRYYDIPNSRGIQSSYSHLTVDNCELLGWSHAAIYLGTGSHDNYIHHNFIHHNQREGLGYGVVLTTGADALIEANVFDWNRHSIAGVRGFPGASYEACYNFVLGNANSHYFDMHGGNDISDPTVPAGGYVKVHHNTFMESSQSAVVIRGVPTEGVWVYKNWALYDPNKFTKEWIFTQSLGNLPGHTPYEKMWVYDNWYGPVRNITVTTPAPVAAFTATPRSGTAPLTVVFKDTSANSPTSWIWNFGDGSTVNATKKDPVHTYAQAGNYTVSLNATNVGGSNTKTSASYITVTTPAPVAAFTATPRSGTAPLTVLFKDTSTNSPTSWIWNFGDGSTVNATKKDPVHTYTKAGNYTVSLNATNVGGSNTKTSASYITVKTPAPVAA